MGSISHEEKWDRVKAHYESSYEDPKTNKPIRFQTKLPDHQIEFLYENMLRLGIAERKYMGRYVND